MVVLAALLAACGKGATDAPEAPLTAAARIEVQLFADSVLVGDSVTATAKAVNRDGGTVALAVVVWSSSDSSVGSVSAGGVMRARNVGTVRLDVIGDGVVGTKPVRIVPRAAMRVRVLAPDTAQLSDEIQISTQVETAEGVALPEVAPRFALADRSIATITQTAVGRAKLIPSAAGSTTLLAIIGRDTTRRPIVLRLTPLRSLSVSVDTRTLAVGDSAPYLVTAIDTGGRTVASTGTEVGVEPAGTMLVRNGFVVATGLGRVVPEAGDGIARDS